MCVGTKSTPKGVSTDDFFTFKHNSTSSGYEALKAAKAEWRQKKTSEHSNIPICDSSGNIRSGYFYILKAAIRAYTGETKVTYAAGFSETSLAEALENAVKRLGQRNWSWKKSDGYSIVQKGRFAGPGTEPSSGPTSRGY